MSKPATMVIHSYDISAAPGNDLNISISGPLSPGNFPPVGSSISLQSDTTLVTSTPGYMSTSYGTSSGARKTVLVVNK